MEAHALVWMHSPTTPATSHAGGGAPELELLDELLLDELLLDELLDFPLLLELELELLELELVPLLAVQHSMLEAPAQ
jgi:hypothetical protein